MVVSSSTSPAVLRLVRVFTDADGRHGNPLGVLDHSVSATADEMLDLTRELGFSETVLLGDGAVGTAWAPPWSSVECGSPSEVDALAGPPDGHDFVQTWAWIDEAAGRVRARVFAPRVRIPEDEACGSASLLLASRLEREIAIEHGRGSVVHARPSGNGIAQVGGRVVLDGRRIYEMARR